MIIPKNYPFPQEKSPFAGPSPHLRQISDHYTRYFGVVAVWHEIISHYVHLDIHVAFPTPERPYYLLLTSGMSDKPMPAPKGHRNCKYCELMLALPPSWNFGDEAFKREENFWPIRFLKEAARFPHQFGAWIWFGHTILKSIPPTTRISGCTDFVGGLVANPVLVDDINALSIRISAAKTIRIWSYIPLLEDEAVHYLQSSSKELGQRLYARGVTELVDPNRRSEVNP